MKCPDCHIQTKAIITEDVNMNTQISASNPKITINNGKPVTTSVAVAEYFHKRHDDVLKKIRVIMAECDEAYRLRNFAETVYHRKNPGDGKEIPTVMFELTRDAFVLIVMAFTGKKALQWKIAYIAEFNRMEAELYAGSQTAAQCKTPDCRYLVKVTILDHLFGGEISFAGKADSFRTIAIGITTKLGYKPVSLIKIPDALRKLTARSSH